MKSNQGYRSSVTIKVPIPSVPRVKVPPVFLTITFDARSLSDKLSKVKENVEDMTNVSKAAAKILRESFKQNFQEGGRPKWKPHAMSTAFNRQFAKDKKVGRLQGAARQRRIDMIMDLARKKAGEGLLVDTGSYRDSFINEGSPHHVSHTDKDGLEIGTNHPLSFHERGTSPYVIKPTRAKSLRFMAFGQVINVKKVEHPGVPARPVLIIQDEDIDAIAEAMLDHVLKGLK